MPIWYATQSITDIVYDLHISNKAASTTPTVATPTPEDNPYARTLDLIRAQAPFVTSIDALSDRVKYQCPVDYSYPSTSREHRVCRRDMLFQVRSRLTLCKR